MPPAAKPPAACCGSLCVCVSVPANSQPFPRPAAATVAAAWPWLLVWLHDCWSFLAVSAIVTSITHPGHSNILTPAEAIAPAPLVPHLDSAAAAAARASRPTSVQRLRICRLTHIPAPPSLKCSPSSLHLVRLFRATSHIVRRRLLGSPIQARPLRRTCPTFPQAESAWPTRLERLFLLAHPHLSCQLHS